MITTYSFPYDSIKDRIIIDKCFVTLPSEDPDSRGIEYKALWDTGAMSTCISVRLAQAMGLIETDHTKVTGANNVPFAAPLYDVQIKMGSYLIPFKRVIGLPMCDEYDLIIGMDIITQGDLSITNYDGHTVITFRTPSLERIDFVSELRDFQKCRKVHDLNVKKRIPDKCACGSGKDYKNCHGKSPYSK